MIRPYNDELAGDLVGKGFKKKFKKLKKKVSKLPTPVKVAINPLSAAKYVPIKNKTLKTAFRLATGDVTAIPSAVKDKKLLKAAINPVSALPIKSNALKTALGDPFAAASIAKKAASGGGSSSSASSIDDESVYDESQDVNQSYGADDDTDIVFAESAEENENAGAASETDEAFTVNEDDEGESDELAELSGDMVGSIFKSLKKGVKKVAKGTAKVATSKAGIAALSAAGGAGAAVAAMKVAQSGVIQNYVKKKFGGGETSPGYGSEDVSNYMASLYAANDEAKANAAPVSVAQPAVKNVSTAMNTSENYPRLKAIPASMMTSSDATSAKTDKAMFGGFDLSKMAIPLVVVAGAVFFLRGRA